MFSQSVARTSLDRAAAPSTKDMMNGRWIVDHVIASCVSNSREVKRGR